ncbi:glucosylceramidase-like [Ceratina calcarata]|uniref:Glucosylceramidase n=1 Tax=Ceratina calcarata TaxID=156304 RepID=A0AAJ7IS80_9HYME|nr:glucosylceramidase-like [Ceratina calcarata]XP_017875575.1 glucosylceramidase-like [Ceratina calcarata]XP_026667179.1 glucosylceramidase-like [Ceratina calcarata]XP_026667181.1 glucosylceramidase-like [Ceratina calcarata]
MWTKNMWTVWIAASLLGYIQLLVQGDANECVPRSFGTDRLACVCNATYCDSTPDNEPKIPEKGAFYWYVSSKAGLRVSLIKGNISENCKNESSSNPVLNINTTKRYQTILGYGGAFTDSTGINIKKLSPATQDQLIRAYYDPKVGSRYLLGRIPIGGTDFSTRPYTYDDHENDTTLAHFALAKEDYDYKIPYIKRALELNPDVKFLSAVWSPPIWMKTNEKINGFSFLKEEYYQIYSDYIMKFLDAYKDNGIKMWAVSTGNEPMSTYVPGNKLSDLGWTPRTMGKWVVENLGPTLANSKHNDTLIIALDDQRLSIPWFMYILYEEHEEAKNYISGTAVHWYFDYLVRPVVLDSLRDLNTDKFIFMTEACIVGEVETVLIGSWDRGERYILSIIEYMNHWSIGWVDWNLALDKAGGPNWINNFVDAPIIVNPDTDEFYKQPMYYALKHFSRFVDRGSVRVSITDTDSVKSTAFVTPSNEVVIVLYNKNATAANVALNDENGRSICLELPAKSMSTVIYAL